MKHSFSEGLLKGFYQANGIQRSGGAGLGLALVKELVEAMNGTITVASSLDEGSCFTIRFPGAGGAIATGSYEREQGQVGSER